MAQKAIGAFFVVHKNNRKINLYFSLINTREIMSLPEDKNKYLKLVQSIGDTIEGARNRAIKAVNTELLKANWEIGKYIVEFEQHGNEKAEYGSALLDTLAKDLKQRFGKGFSKSNVYLMRQFYLKFPIFQTLSGFLEI